MYELSNFGTEEPPLYPYGRAKPPAPPQTKVLGVDKTKAPVWKFEFNMHSLYGISEKLPPPGYQLGCGPELGRVRSIIAIQNHYKNSSPYK